MTLSTIHVRIATTIAVPNGLSEIWLDQVVRPRSTWSTDGAPAPPSAAPMPLSKDGKTGLIVAGIAGGENDAQQYAKGLAAELIHDRPGVTVQDGGEAMIYAQISGQSELLLMESIAIPLSFIVLVWVFGGLLAAALHLAVGCFATLGAMAVLRAITFFTEVSIFALNLTVAMGLALAIDYTLLIISRFRPDLAEPKPWPGLARSAFTHMRSSVEAIQRHDG